MYEQICSNISITLANSIQSVGLLGGYTQGGGHSMLSSVHGMGADQVLSIKVVTADGNFVTASPTENTDLFWAIRGGGGSSFGIVTSMVIKAFKEMETTAGTLGWSVHGNNISVDTFWKGISSYFSYFKNFTDQGTSAEWNIWPKGDIADSLPEGNPSIEMVAFIAPGKTLEQTLAITGPWLAEMKALGIDVKANWTQFTSYYAAYHSVFTSSADNILPYNMGYASRLVPRENFDKNKKLNLTIAAYRKLAEEGHSLNGYQYSPTLSAGSPVGRDGNAVNPAWRNALSHTIVFIKWPQNLTTEEQLRVRREFATGGMRQLRDATLGAGSYLNEGDRLEPDFQQSFYGDNYQRLLKIKKEVDPEYVFWAATAVGSESWAVKSVDGLPNENGPLCRAW
jgi:hypothetical protein